MLGGLTVGIVALPLAIALAIASGVKPEQGLYTAIFAGFVIAVLGGTRAQISGPTGAFIVIVYGIVQQYGYDGLAIATLIAGVLLVLMGLMRMGAFSEVRSLSGCHRLHCGHRSDNFLVAGKRPARTSARKGTGRLCRKVDRVHSALRQY